jgi:hypothetical protein
VAFDCASDDALMSVRLEWSSTTQPFQSVATDRIVCGGVQSITVPLSARVPGSPGVLQIVVNSLRGGVVGVDEVSLRPETK